jgi:hypothetical protein
MRTSLDGTTAPPRRRHAGSGAPGARKAFYPTGKEVSNDLSHLNNRSCKLGHVAYILRNKCNTFVAAASHRVRRAHSHAAHLSLAWLWLSARLSSAARQQRSILWLEGGNPQHSGLYATLLVLRRAPLFRQSWILPRTLQWGQFRPVLDLDADRADVELWVEASRTCGLPTIKRPQRAEIGDVAVDLVVEIMFVHAEADGECLHQRGLKGQGLN